jgi:hypothetical protein
LAASENEQINEQGKYQTKLNFMQIKLPVMAGVMSHFGLDGVVICFCLSFNSYTFSHLGVLFCTGWYSFFGSCPLVI